ncbi:MAG: response regulator [bacterium]
MSKDLNCRESIKSRDEQSKKIILLADEDPKIGAALQEFFHDFLTAEGYRMIQATTLSDALAHLEQEKIGLIITDLRLSQYSGLSLLIRVRTMPYKVPVIVMSAYTDFISEEDWKLLGATEFISKPPDLSRLREVISRILKRKSGEMQSQSE